MVDPLGRRSGRKTSRQWTWKTAVVTMLGNKGRPRTARSTLPWTSLWVLVVWTRWKSHLNNQIIIWKDQVRGWFPLWVSIPLEGQRKSKKQGYPLMELVLRIFIRILRILRIWLMRVMWVRGPNKWILTVIYIYPQILKSVWWKIWVAQYKRTRRVRKILLIRMYVIRTRENQKGSTRMRANQKVFTSISVLQRRANQNRSKNGYKYDYEQSKIYK